MDARTTPSEKRKVLGVEWGWAKRTFEAVE
jgi:hypothetical protein